MRYRFEDTIGWPVATVVAVPRDRVQRLCAYLPAVDTVEELERTVQDGQVILRRRWILAPDLLPPGIRGLVPDDAVGFEDHLVFDGDRSARFTITPLLHADALVFEGQLHVHDEGDQTQLEVDAAFTITPSGAQRLPPSVRSRGVPTLESTIIGIVKAQLRQACRAIETLLDDEW